MFRKLLSFAVIGLLLGPGAVSVASAKSGKAAAEAAKAEAKAKAKEAAKKEAVEKGKDKAKAFGAKNDKLIEEAKAAVEELKKETDKAKWNEARLARISKLAAAKNDPALSELIGKLKAKEDERHKAILAYYEPLAAKAPAEEPAK
jgi:colicin import membrane protein